MILKYIYKIIGSNSFVKVSNKWWCENGHGGFSSFHLPLSFRAPQIISHGLSESFRPYHLRDILHRGSLRRAFVRRLSSSFMKLCGVATDVGVASFFHISLRIYKKMCFDTAVKIEKISTEY